MIHLAFKDNSISLLQLSINNRYLLLQSQTLTYLLHTIVFTFESFKMKTIMTAGAIVAALAFLMSVSPPPQLENNVLTQQQPQRRFGQIPQRMCLPGLQPRSRRQQVHKRLLRPVWSQPG